MIIIFFLFLNPRGEVDSSAWGNFTCGSSIKEWGVLSPSVLTSRVGASYTQQQNKCVQITTTTHSPFLTTILSQPGYHIENFLLRERERKNKKKTKTAELFRPSARPIVALVESCQSGEGTCSSVTKATLARHWARHCLPRLYSLLQGSISFKNILLQHTWGG